MYSAAPEAVPLALCREYCFPPYDGFFFAVVRQLNFLIVIINGNSRRIVSAELYFDIITSSNLADL